MDLIGTNPVPKNKITSAFSGIDKLVDEDTLDLKTADMSFEDSQNHVASCDTHLTYKNNMIPEGNLTLVEVHVNKFADLFNEASNKRLGSERYITALCITFGADGNTVIPIVQSVYLKWVGYDAVSQKDIYTARSNSFGVNKIFNGTDFVTISTGDKTAFVTNYRENIKIKHKSTLNLSGFVEGTDVESVIVPFQFLYSVIYYHNIEQGGKVEPLGVITQGVREVLYDRNSPIKHFVFVSGARLAGIIDTPVKYANRSHLCPPCSNLADNFGFDLGQ